MQRIALIGSPGSGKSTVAKQMGHALGLPVHHLDSLFWQPGWVRTPRPEWIALQERLVAGERWIIDGNYSNTMPLRLAAADTVVFLDLPRTLCLWRALKRVFQYRRRSRPDMAEGCPERIDLEFFRWVWNFPHEERPKIVDRLKAVDGRSRVIWLRSPREVARFLSELGA